MIPIINDSELTRTQKAANSYYSEAYKKISNFVFQTKPAYAIEILFILPRDQ